MTASTSARARNERGALDKTAAGAVAAVVALVGLVFFNATRGDDGAATAADSVPSTTRSVVANPDPSLDPDEASTDTTEEPEATASPSVLPDIAGVDDLPGNMMVTPDIVAAVESAAKAVGPAIEAFHDHTWRKPFQMWLDGLESRLTDGFIHETTEAFGSEEAWKQYIADPKIETRAVITSVSIPDGTPLPHSGRVVFQVDYQLESRSGDEPWGDVKPITVAAHMAVQADDSWLLDLLAPKETNQ